MDQTIVAVYDTAAHASLAVQDLEAAGVPSSAISQHGSAGTAVGSAEFAPATHHEQGFWASLFGADPDAEYDTRVYDRSVASGSTVVTVKAPAEYHDQVAAILENHSPIDIDERASSYGVTGASYGTGAAALGSSTTGRGEEVIQLSEETLAVGKRAINRGTTRVRRYVVETPVEEQVSLRDETVSIERRAVTDGRPVTNADFSDKIIEVTETGEEAVVAKTARVREEVVIGKQVTDRTETVRDTVRHEDVEITKEPGVTTTGTAYTTSTTTTPKI